MKNNRFLSAIVLFACTASMVGCETEPEGDGPEQGEIRVEAVEWKDDLKNVIPVVVEEFKAARDKANAVYNDASATQDEVNVAFDRLASVMHKSLLKK